ncbi:hypothetical protein MMC26_004962 [Xylographa opegraphella]|nr:hypothetical protein [Xylographa opegraphella]
MSPIISANQTGPPARRARKRQRRRGRNSTEDKVSLEYGVIKSGKEDIDSSRMRAISEDAVITNSHEVTLLSPVTNANPGTSSTKQEARTVAVACASKQPHMNDIVLAPPQSAFTFSCSRPVSTTSNVRGYAGSQRNTPVRVSAAGSPCPKVSTSSPRLLGNGELSGEGLSNRGEATADKILLSTEIIKPGLQSHAHKGVALIQPQSVNNMVDCNLALPHKVGTDGVACGWPMPEPLIMAPATKDRKSRFLPALSKMITTDSQSLAGGNEAPTGTIVRELVASPVSYTDALEHQVADPVVDPKPASSRGSTDSGYGTKSRSPSIEASPTWSHSPGSEHDWEGTDVRFWMRE